MNKQNYTSLELSKWLAKNGCGLESELIWFTNLNIDLSNDSFVWNLAPKCNVNILHEHYPAYDILNDICCKYAKEFWGEDDEWMRKFSPYFHSSEVLDKMMKGQKQKAEKYIKEHCIFNPEKNERQNNKP